MGVGESGIDFMRLCLNWVFEFVMCVVALVVVVVKGVVVELVAVVVIVGVMIDFNSVAVVVVDIIAVVGVVLVRLPAKMIGSSALLLLRCRSLSSHTMLFLCAGFCGCLWQTAKCLFRVEIPVPGIECLSYFVFCRSLWAGKGLGRKLRECQMGVIFLWFAERGCVGYGAYP